MSYKKPEMKKIAVALKINKKADEQSSCKGGHCVKAIYENDRP